VNSVRVIGYERRNARPNTVTQYTADPTVTVHVRRYAVTRADPLSVLIHDWKDARRYAVLPGNQYYPYLPFLPNPPPSYCTNGSLGVTYARPDLRVQQLAPEQGLELN
jgi:hypothetical protein